MSGASADSEAVTVVEGNAAWDLLSSVSLGRLVTAFGGRPEIFPVNFVTQKSGPGRERTVLFRTAEGTKLFTSVMNDQVLFEADDHGATAGWSVIVRGTARVLTAAADIHEAEHAQLMPWVATEKLRYVRITPDEGTARRFRFGPEPDHGSLPG